MYVDKPWGHELIWARTRDYVGKLIHINANSKLSRQYHVKKDESIFVMKGELTLELGIDELRQTLVLKEGQSFRIAPYTVHRFVATTSGVDLIEVSTPELKDVVRLADEYGRTSPEDEALSLLD